MQGLRTARVVGRRDMSTNKNLLYPFWFGAIIICSVLVLVSIVFVACADPNAESLESPPVSETAISPTPDPQNPDDGAAQQTAQTATRLALTEAAGAEYIDKFVFLGDSTTNGLRDYGVLSGGTATTQVWTPTSGTLSLFNQSIATIVYPETGQEISISDAVAEKKPEYLMITLGVNGVSSMEEDYFKSEYTALVTRIKEASPETIIILNSIYPVASDYRYIGEISNEKIAAANAWIEQIAQETGVKYLYTYETIADEFGTLPQNLQNGDGIHLSTEGYNKVLEYIRTHAYNLEPKN